MSALECDFPAAELSHIGEHESWRKEVHRPATSTHKWWAKRLGSVFRGILCSAVTTDSASALEAYGSAARLDGLTVFDPFAGSGTTLIEAVKLGANVIGWDINPVATLVQRQAVQRWNIAELQRAYGSIEKTCRAEIDRVHRTETGETVLYYFWVASADCPECHESTRLFSTHVYSQNAYPKRVPEAQVVCPTCLDVMPGRYDFETLTCSRGHRITRQGAVSRSTMTCVNGHSSKVLTALAGTPPRHEMYAKLVLGFNGRKRYEPLADFDRVLNAEDPEREALIALFSGTLEFNNMFCSFKGEGTGAVRHMFSHHILKPERTPLEAHPWGTPFSSGSFSTLYQSRLIRAHAYKTAPADQIMSGQAVKRIASISLPTEAAVASSWPSAGLTPGLIYLRTGNSSHTDLPDESVDLIITDPPYMDNVHYSELADFFHAWLRALIPFPGYPTSTLTTRSAGEVQSASPQDFENSITNVLRE